MQSIFIGTTNPGKIREFKLILSRLDLQLETPQSLNCSFDPPEIGTRFEEIALAKARVWAKKSNLPALVDDSGLMIDALDGKPGIYSKRFFEGSSQDRNQFVVDSLDKLRNKSRTARFICALAFVDLNSKYERVVTGSCEGEIASYIAESNQVGFDYDYIFIPKGYENTLSELGQDIKNKLSHRARALAKMLPTLRRWKQ